MIERRVEYREIALINHYGAAYPIDPRERLFIADFPVGGVAYLVEITPAASPSVTEQEKE